MLLRDFSKPVVIANLVAWPLGYLAAQTYLGVFIQRIALTPLPVSGELAGVELFWWLDPQWRRGTTAVRLLELGETWAFANGAVWLQMIQPIGNDRLAEFYRRRGFLALETTWQKRLAA